MGNKTVSIIKKVSFGLGAMTMCVSLFACGNSNSSKVAVTDLQAPMLSADDSLPEMITVNNDSENAGELFASISDVDYDKIDSYFLSYSAEGLADEIAVVRVKNASDVNEVESSIENHVDNRIKLFQSYDPDQVSRAEDAVVFTNGNDVVLIISDNSDQVKSAYEEAAR